ncbi:MAG: hypothetical protein WBI64_00045 [Bacillota bacterium]|nr:hypothetical protein [Bacillota bacterium]
MGSSIMDYLARFVQRITGGTEEIKTPQLQKIAVLVVIGLIGILLLLISFSPRLSGPSVYETGSGLTRQDQALAMGGVGGINLVEDEARLERSLAEILSQVHGAGRVSVKITFETGRMYDYAENETYEESSLRETDTQGITRETTQVRKAGEIVTTQERATGSVLPVVLNFQEPRIQGVLVVADGAKDIAVKKALTEAVATLFDIPYHKVAVLPRKR